MRAIGTTQDSSQARCFGDYLLTLGIRNSVNEGRQGWVGPVGNVAHAAGLLVGMAWAWVPYRLRR